MNMPLSFQPDEQMDSVRADHARRRTLRRLTTAAIVLLVFAGAYAAYAWLEPGVPRISAQNLWIDTAHVGDFEISAHGTGVLVPQVQRWLSAQSSATIEGIKAPPGTRVAANDVVLLMSNPALSDKLTDARTALLLAQSDETSKLLATKGQILSLESSLAALQANQELAKLKQQSQTKLLQSGVVSRFQVAQTKRKVQVLTKQMGISKQRLAGLRQSLAEQARAGKARIEQLQQELAQRQRQVDALQVRAGIDGVVQSIKVVVGKQVAAGAPLGLVIQPTPLDVQLRIPQAEARELTVGMTAQISVRGTTVAGHVARIMPSVQNGAIETLVEPDLALPPDARPDLGVSGTIQIDHYAHVLSIARPPGIKANSATWLYRLDASGHAKRVQVHVGRVSAERMEITGGLHQGDRVVLSNLADWHNPPVFRLR